MNTPKNLKAKYMQINLNKLREYEEQGLIRSQTHPESDLIIWNYTQKCQGERKFDDYTIMCRGLVTDPLGQVYARPFDKFFNWDEHESPELKDIPQNETFVAYDKMDGSLGILYWVGEIPYIATRGSFTSDQATWATSIFRKIANYSFFDKSKTYLFEILVKWNRIVVSYDFEGLVLLAIRDIESGQFVNLPKHSWKMQKGSSRNDSREHIQSSERMENVSILQKGELQKGSREVWRETEREYEVVEVEKQKEIKRARDEQLQEDQEIPRPTKRCSVCGLWEQISTVRYGFSSQGEQNNERGEVQKSPKNERRSFEMRYCLCKLSSHTNLGEEKIKIVDEVTDYSTPRENAEGVVLYFKSGFMVKVKYDEYVRLHRLVTGVTKRRIWDLLRNGEPVDELLERVPEEFEKWVRSTIDDLLGQFNEMRKNAENVLVKVVGMDTRKEQAIYVNTYPSELRGIVFAMLDRKPIEPIIWRLLKPKHEVPFKEEI